MRLTALASMKIEGDVIEEFVRHTLRFVDRVIVIDNGSLDASREILCALASEGLPVTVWEGEAVASRIEGWTAPARRAFATVPTEYLLMLDVDEFVRAPSRSALEDALRALDGAHALVPWVTYLPTPDDDAGESRALARLRHRVRRESMPTFKVFVHRSFMEHPGASIVTGNHGVLDSDATAVSSIVPGIELAHLPVRNAKQIQSKALLGWPQFLAAGFTKEQGFAHRWCFLNERLLSEPLWDRDEFLLAAQQYLDTDGELELVLDPLPPTERRYPHDAPELLPLAVALIRQFALAYAACNQLHRETQTRAENQLAREAQLGGEAKAALAVERAAAQTAVEALGHVAAEVQRYHLDRRLMQEQLRELHGLLRDLQQSNSWRLTLPVRLAGKFLRKAMSRFRRQADRTYRRGDGGECR